MAKTIDMNSGDLIETASTGDIVFTDEGIKRVNSNYALVGLYGKAINIGDIWFGECTWVKHYASYKLYNGDEYSDVLELNCSDDSWFYSKNNGIIKIKYVLTSSVKDYEVVEYLKRDSLTLGDISSQYGPDFSVF